MKRWWITIGQRSGTLCTSPETFPTIRRLVSPSSVAKSCCTETARERFAVTKIGVHIGEREPLVFICKNLISYFLEYHYCLETAESGMLLDLVRFGRGFKLNPILLNIFYFLYS